MSDKEATLKLVDDEYTHLRQAIDGLDEAAMSRVWFGDWGVKDIVAHVAGWEREMSAALERMARGERPTPEGVDYSDSDAWNAGFALSMRNIPAPTVIASWQQTHANYVKAANAVGSDRYGTKEDGTPMTVNRLLETSGYGHYKEHAAQIRDWRQKEGL
jgi:hypothetical protein